MSSRSDDEQDPDHALFLCLQAESARNVAEREAKMTPEEKAREEAKDAKWLAERDASHAARKAPKPPKARKPPKAPKPEASRKRKRPDDSETGGGQVTETSSDNPEGGPPPQKRGRGRPKGSKNKPKAGQAGARQQPEPPRDSLPVNQQGDSVHNHTGTVLDPISLMSPEPEQERGPLDGPPVAQSEAPQQQPAPEEPVDYFAQRLKAEFALNAKKASPPSSSSRLTPPAEKASVASAQDQAQSTSELMPGSEEKAEDESLDDEDELIEAFNNIKYLRDIVEEEHVGVEMASAQNGPMHDGVQSNGGGEPCHDSKDQLPEDIGSFEDEDLGDLDEDDLFGDGLLEESTIAEVQHDVGSFEDEDMNDLDEDDLFGDGLLEESTIAEVQHDVGSFEDEDMNDLDEDDLFGDGLLEESTIAEVQYDAPTTATLTPVATSPKTASIDEDMDGLDEDDLFGDGLLEESTIAEVQHDAPTTATLTPAATLPRTASIEHDALVAPPPARTNGIENDPILKHFKQMQKMAELEAMRQAQLTFNTAIPPALVSGPDSANSGYCSRSSSVAPTVGSTASVSASEAEAEAATRALIEANMGGIQEAPVSGNIYGAELRAAYGVSSTSTLASGHGSGLVAGYPAASISAPNPLAASARIAGSVPFGTAPRTTFVAPSGVASSAHSGTASHPTPNRVVSRPPVGRAQPGAKTINGYQGQPHLGVSGKGMGTHGMGQMTQQQHIALQQQHRALQQQHRALQQRYIALQQQHRALAMQKMASRSFFCAPTAASDFGSGAVFDGVSTAALGTAPATVAWSVGGNIALTGNAASASVQNHHIAYTAQPRASQPPSRPPSVLPAGQQQQAIGHRNPLPHSSLHPQPRVTPSHHTGTPSMDIPRVRHPQIYQQGQVQQPQARQQVQGQHIYQQGQMQQPQASQQVQGQRIYQQGQMQQPQDSQQVQGQHIYQQGQMEPRQTRQQVQRPQTIINLQHPAGTYPLSRYM
ncbi:hypothetical protein QBC45DRAFT_443164 [Copromyces sp. CBS 386.78]|nr:hypothetical protein QBC45DRAFT_443164 [Copromyces sp. CBS 386.78]